MKLGIVTYNIGKDWDLDTLIANCEETGFDGVELRTTHAHGVEVELSAAERTAVRKRFGDSKVEIVGLGSACSAQSKEPSKILMGLGLSEEQARCSLRISFSENNTLEDVDQFLEAFGVAYQALYPTFLQKA